MPFQPAILIAAFGTSGFTEVTELTNQHQAVDLLTGFSDKAGPTEIKVTATATLQIGVFKMSWETIVPCGRCI